MMFKIRRGIITVWLFIMAVFLTNAQEVPDTLEQQHKWQRGETTPAVARLSVYDLVFISAKPYSNPYTNVTLTAVFTGPDHSRRTLAGFWDGGNRYIIRVSLSQQGIWNYQTQSTDPALDRQQGQLLCTAPVAGMHGFLRRDAQYPYHFVYDDGSRFFMMGQTYYNLLGSETGRSSYRTAIDSCRAVGMTKVRMCINGWLSEVAATEPVTQGIDRDGDRINVAFFQHADSVISYMQAHDMVADLIVMPRHILGTALQEERYQAYIVARYAAFSNVIWCLTNEWNYSARPKTYWTRLGSFIKQHDPWSVLNNQPRLMSIHQQTRLGFQFFGENWLSHAILQYGVRNRGRDAKNEWKVQEEARFRNGDEWGYASIEYNRWHCVPIVNDEYGYIGEPEDVSESDTVALTRRKHRQILWGIIMAGGYASAGDKTFYPGIGRPYMSGFWHSAPEYDDIRHLVSFFTGPDIHYWKLTPASGIVRGQLRVYALASPDKDYVIYTAVGGPVHVLLPKGRYKADRFNPVTGDRQSIGTITGGQRKTFRMPEGQDWVIVVTRSA